MAWFSRIRRRLAVLFHRDRFARELEEEMQSHLELQSEDNQENGMAAPEAARAARRQFGNATLLNEISRETWGWSWLERLTQDLTYSLRVLRKNPGFTAVAVVVLALGSGANTAIFTVVNAVLLQPLPYPNPDRLVFITEVNPKRGLEAGWVAPGNYLEWRDRSRLIEDMGAFVSDRSVLTGAGEPVRLDGVGATASLLSTLRVRTVLGRGFTPEEDQPGKSSVVLLSERLWRGRFAARRDILGQTVLLDSQPFTVIGVVAQDTPLDGDPWDLWVPLALGPDARDTHTSFYLFAIGRMKPGVKVEQARAELRVIGEGIYSRALRGGSGWEVVTEKLTDHLVRNARPQLLLLAIAVGLLLLVACGNVANLLLTRSAQRSRELAVRAALGAGRWRIVRQLLTESLLLALLAGAAGLLLALWAVRILYHWMPSSIQPGVQPGIDLTVLGFTLAVSAGTGVLFGLLPAFKAARPDLVDSLKEAGRGIAFGRGRLSGAFVVAQAALAVMLLVGAGLLMRSFARLLSVDLGFRPDHLLTFQVPLSSDKYKDAERLAFYEDLIQRLENLPGARSVATVEFLPIEGSGVNNEFAVEGRPPAGYGAFVGVRIVSPGYFQAMGIPLVSGRALDPHDNAAAPPVALINQTMASASWPGENPVGKRFKLNPRGESPWIRVVGVVHDVKHFGLDGKRWPEAYFPQRQRPYANMRLVVRTSADPMRLAPAVRGVIQRMDPNVPAAELRSMESIIGNSVAPRELSMILVASFAGLALALASIGLYGVISYSVVERRHELGIRMALGAARRDVLGLLLARGIWLTLAGLLIGVAGSLAITKLLSEMLFGVARLDPVTYCGVAVVVLATASAAIAIPARRATRIDPMEALRYE